MRAGSPRGVAYPRDPAEILSARRSYPHPAGAKSSPASSQAAQDMGKILSFQIVLVALATGIGYLYGGLHVAQAVLFGGAVACTNALLLAWRLHQGKRRLHADAGRHLRSMYASAFERFVMVALLLAAGLGFLQLEALPLLLGFILGQLAFQISGLLIEIH